jgi:tRNA (guanine37-N1)-methyltransferase
MRISLSFADIIGVDQRVRDHFITKEILLETISGELGALVLSDALIRLIPGF